MCRIKCFAEILRTWAIPRMIYPEREDRRSLGARPPETITTVAAGPRSHAYD